jgi:Toastrack DUF4097
MGAVSTRSFEFAGIRQLIIDNYGAGSIMVEPSSDADRVEGWLDAADQRFLDEATIRQEREYLRISVPQTPWRSSNAHLRLAVPAGIGCVIKTGSADVSISADIDRSKIVSGSGDVSIGRAVDLEATTGSGNLSVAELAGRAARLGTGSGDITIDSASCQLAVKSGSGDILLKSLADAELRASSGSGDVSITATSGSVDLRSASGSISVGVADKLVAWLDLNSVSGSVRIGLDATGKPEPGQAWISVRARTASGNISVFRA